MEGKVFFYSHEEANYGFLSNLYPSSFWIGSFKWPTVEHYFYAKMITSGDFIEKIKTCQVAGKVKEIVANNGEIIRSNWEDIKENMMYDALHAKFSQNIKLTDLLSETKESEIIFNDKSDSYWGIGKNGDGENRLGLLLCKVREDICSVQNTGVTLPPWIQYKGIASEDLFWGMGIGESCIMKWFEDWNKLTTSEKENYKQQFPSPAEWADFYEN